MSKDYKKYQDWIKQEQSDLPREEVVAQMEDKAEYVFDMDNIKPIKHAWIDRGAKMSCEHAGHPNHQAWKRSRV